MASLGCVRLRVCFNTQSNGELANAVFHDTLLPSQSLADLEDRVLKKSQGAPVALPLHYSCPLSPGSPPRPLHSLQELRAVYSELTSGCCSSSSSLMPLHRITVYAAAVGPSTSRTRQSPEKQCSMGRVLAPGSPLCGVRHPDCGSDWLQLGPASPESGPPSDGEREGDGGELVSPAWEASLLANILQAVRQHDFTGRGRTRRGGDGAAAAAVPPTPPRLSTKRPSSDILSSSGGGGGGGAQAPFRRHPSVGSEGSLGVCLSPA